jgi:hypothetical protein
MAINYGNVKATFYRDFISQQSVNPPNGTIGGPLTFGRTTIGTYVGSDGYIKTAAINEPRFTYEYDSNGVLQYRGLYIDNRPFSYNNFLYSEALTNAYWTVTNGSVSNTSTLSPNGVDNGQKLSLTSAGGNINKLVTVTGGTVGSLRRVLYISIMAKAAECSHLNIKVDNGTNTVDCYYNLSTGATGNNTCGVGCVYPTGVAVNGLQFIYKHICNMGNGWFRCILCVQDIQSSSSANFTVSFIPSTSNSSLTINSSGDGLLLWGAMFDYGLNVTSSYHSCFSNYIKTTTAIGSCGADICYISANDSMENFLLGGNRADSCAAYAEFTTPYFFRSTIVGNILQCGGGIKYGNGGAMSMRINTIGGTTGYVQHLYRPVTGGAYDFTIGAPTPLLSTNNKMIISNRQFAPISSAMNGIVSSSTSNLVPQRFNLLSIPGTACYKKIIYIPTYLNSAQLARLTTL